MYQVQLQFDFSFIQLLFKECKIIHQHHPCNKAFDFIPYSNIELLSLK